MLDRNQYLLELVKRNVKAYIANPKTKAVILVESVQNLVGVLSGLNRLYYSTFQFKRMSGFVEQMKIAPENLAARLEGLFHYEASVAVNELETLVRETVKLVEVHMPQVDTSSAKRKLGWRQQPWKLGESNR
jgi:hypothetical protein